MLSQVLLYVFPGSGEPEGEQVMATLGADHSMCKLGRADSLATQIVGADLSGVLKLNGVASLVTETYQYLTYLLHNLLTVIFVIYIFKTDISVKNSALFSLLFWLDW